jgi:hypothetical protein
MIGPQPARDNEAVSRWLTERHRDLVSDLTDTLDLDAGLRDIDITADHQASVSDLSNLLDLDAGLAAILPTPEDLADPDIPKSPSEHSAPSQSGERAHRRPHDRPHVYQRPGDRARPRPSL